jgi:hypothetical protein
VQGINVSSNPVTKLYTIKVNCPNGKNVIYGDFRRDWMKEFRMTGMITEDNFGEFKRGEMVGKLKEATIDELKEELNKYNAERGEWLREQIVNDFNIEKTAYEYLSGTLLSTSEEKEKAT